MSYSRPSCNRSSTNFAATWCGAGISELLTKPLQRTPYQSATAPTHGASPSKKRLATLPSIHLTPVAMAVAALPRHIIGKMTKQGGLASSVAVRKFSSRLSRIREENFHYLKRLGMRSHRASFPIFSPGLFIPGQHMACFYVKIVPQHSRHIFHATRRE